MLSFRRETEYAIQFLRVLAKSGNGVSLKEVSEKIGVSFLFLQKIARKLRAAHLISAEKGVNGGYQLLESSKKLSLRKIVLIIEEDCRLLPCFYAKYQCAKSKGCILKGKVSKINTEFLKMLDKIKLADL